MDVVVPADHTDLQKIKELVIQRPSPAHIFANIYMLEILDDNFSKVSSIFPYGLNSWHNY